MPSKVQSLGDGESDLVLETDSRPLPGKRSEIVAAFEEILSLGKVQRVVVEVGKPISFSRLVPKTPEDPSEVVSEDPYEVMTNYEIEEYSPEKNFTIFELLMRSFSILTRKGFTPESIFVSKLPPLRRSLGVDQDWDLERLFGIPLLRTDHIPENVLVLTGTKEKTKYSLRMLIPARKS